MHAVIDLCMLGMEMHVSVSHYNLQYNCIRLITALLVYLLTLAHFANNGPLFNSLNVHAMSG